MPFKTPDETAVENRLKLATYKHRLYHARSNMTDLSRRSGISVPTIWRAIKTGKAKPQTIFTLEKTIAEIEAQAVAA